MMDKLKWEYDAEHSPTPEPEYAEYYDQSIMSLKGVSISSAGDVLIPVTHFGLFPWDKLDMANSNYSTLIRGGHPLTSRQWTLCFWLTNKEGVVHPLARRNRWVMPEGLVGFMEWARRSGKSDLKCKIRKFVHMLTEGD